MSSTLSLRFQNHSHRSVQKRWSRRVRRRGSVVVLSLFLMMFLFGLLALATDVGYIYLSRTELQNAADSSALAAAAKLYPMADSVEMYSFYDEPDIAGAKSEAQLYARYNGAGKYQGRTTIDGKFLQLDPNDLNAGDGDITTGQFHNPSMHSLPLIPTTVFPNTVQVTARLADGHVNGSDSLFFARVIGFTEKDISATAAATVIHASLLPFATSLDKWNSLETGGDGDSYTYSNGVTSGAGDGIAEIIIYPESQWDGSDLPPGNFGALSLGTETASAADLRRQIDQGPTADELAYHGVLSEGVIISGKTGMNATVKTAFNGGWDNSDLRYYAGIIGHPRFLPVYNDVEGNGTNSQFQIVKFVGTRIMAVNMKGKNKSITLQPILKTKNMMRLHLTR